MLLVAQPDVTALWSAAKIQEYLGEAVGSRRVRLVINRSRKIPGLSNSDIETATRIKTIHHLPNQFNVVSSSIERGMPLVCENHTDIARAFVDFTSELAERPVQKVNKKGFSLFAR